MADLWRQYGWRWLGPPIKDWMHFDFAGTPADARTMTDRARAELGMCQKCDDIIDGVSRFLQGEPAPKDGPGLKVHRALSRAATLPKPQAGSAVCDNNCSCRATDVVPAHTHRTGPPVVTEG
jgi:hypothetical protein